MSENFKLITQNFYWSIAFYVVHCIFKISIDSDLQVLIISLMEVSSVSPRVPPPGNLGRGWFFCAKSPTLGDKLLSNFPRGGATGRGSFHAKVKVLVLFIKNGHLPLQLIKKIQWKCRKTFWESFVVVFVTYRYKWLTENSW